MSKKWWEVPNAFQALLDSRQDPGGSMIINSVYNALLVESVKTGEFSPLHYTEICDSVDPKFFDSMDLVLQEFLLRPILCLYEPKTDDIKVDSKKHLYISDFALFYYEALPFDAAYDRLPRFIVYVLEWGAAPHLTNRIQELRRKYKDSKEKPMVYTISRGFDGYSLDELGLGGIPLEEDNYIEATVDDFYSVAEDLKKKDPAGRLVVLDGAAGTGKTYLVRGLIQATPKCRFVIVPPHLVAHLGDPDFIGFFISERETGENAAPMVLVLEDADSCLVSRGADNMASVSAILNLADGILGAALDLRIIATTNAPRTDIDPALIRKGRLSACITLDELPKDHLAEIYMRLTKSDKVTALAAVETCKVLADVYSASRGKVKETVIKGLKKREPAGFHQ